MGAPKDTWVLVCTLHPTSGVVFPRATPPVSFPLWKPVRTATNLLPPQGNGEINERTFVKFALICAWKEHFSPKYKGDDSLIRSSGFSGRHTQVLFLTLGSSLKSRGKCAAELGLGNQDLDVLGVASFAHPCRDEINL